MGFFLTLALWVGTFVLSQLLTPDPDIEDARPASLDDFNFPTATEGRVIPLNYGTNLVKGPNVIWYGDLRAIPIKERIDVSLFHKKTIITGHDYYIGFQMGICQGPAVLKAIYIGEVKVWEGTQSSDGEIDIYKGVRGKFHFYTGTTTQIQDEYLEEHQDPCPAYRGLCYGVFKGGWVGTNTTIQPWSFEIQRIPTGLTGGTYSAVNAGYDSNPMEIAFELFTDPEQGFGYSSSEIDISDWEDAAQTLFQEGNGMSFLLAKQNNIQELIKEIERQIDGHFRIDPTTGKWKCGLIRGGYSTEGLKTADVSNISEMIELSRGTWEGTINSVRIAYSRRSNDYAEGYAQAHDAANMQIQGQRMPAIFSYIGVRNDALANRLAWRELRAQSFPFAKTRFKGDRTFWDSYIGEVILLTYEFEGFVVEDMAFRVIKIDYGNMENSEIIVDAVQDIFSWGDASFADPDVTQWAAPGTDIVPFAADDQKAFELPYAIQRRQVDTSEGRIWVGAINQGKGEAGFELHYRESASFPPSGDYYSVWDSRSILDRAILAGNIDQDQTQIDVLLPDAASAAVMHRLGLHWPADPDKGIGESLISLFMIEDEIIAAQNVSWQGGWIRMTGCLRGLCDTAQAEHATGLRVWFLATKDDLPNFLFTNDYHLDLKYVPYDENGDGIDPDDVGISVVQLKLDYRPRRPYPPTFMKWNTVQYPTSVNITSDVAATFNRRDYRIFNEYSQHSTDASTINGDFPANNNTKYRLKIWDGETLKYAGDWNDGSASVTMTFEKILRYLDGLPTSLTMSLDTKHTYSSVDYEAMQEIFHTASVQSSTYDDDVWLGVCPPSTTSPYVWEDVPDTGTYGFTIDTTLSGDVEARINGGSWQQVIVAGNYSGNLTGVTAGDDIEVRHLDSTTTDPEEVLLEIDSPSSSEDGFAILTFV